VWEDVNEASNAIKEGRFEGVTTGLGGGGLEGIDVVVVGVGGESDLLSIPSPNFCVKLMKPSPPTSQTLLLLTIPSHTPLLHPTFSKGSEALVFLYFERRDNSRVVKGLGEEQGAKRSKEEIC